MTFNDVNDLNDFTVLSIFEKNKDYFKFVTSNSFMPCLVIEVCKTRTVIDYTQSLAPARGIQSHFV